MKKIFGLLMLTAFFAFAAFADVRVPDTPRPTPAKTVKPVTTAVDVTMQIEFSEKEKTARLIIPRGKLAALRAELDAIDGGSTTAAGISRAQTVAGGLFLSLAVVFGGVWFVRAGKNASKKVKIAAAGAVLFASGAFASIAFANIAPFRSADITSQIFNNDYFKRPMGVRGGVNLEIDESGDQIRLIVPRVKSEDSE